MTKKLTNDLLKHIGNQPYSATSLTGRGWLSVELVVPNWRGHTWAWIYWQQAKLLWNFWKQWQRRDRSPH